MKSIFTLEKLFRQNAMRLDPGQIEVLDEKMTQVLKRKTSGQRIRIGFAIWQSAYKMLKSHLNASHPDWSSKKLKLEVARRLSDGAV